MTYDPTPAKETYYEALAEQAYAEMYESGSPSACYNDLKYYFARAIGEAERAGLADDAARLTKRLEHCTAVYRSQFWVSGGGRLPRWNFVCPACDAKLVRSQIAGTSERVPCPYCGARLPECDVSYRLVEAPRGGVLGRFRLGRFRWIRALRSSARVARACDLLVPVVPALAVVFLSCAGIALILEPGAARLLLVCAAALLGGVIFVIEAVSRR